MGKNTRLGVLALVVALLVTACAGSVDLGSQPPGRCLLAEGLSAAPPEDIFSVSFVRWDELAVVSCSDGVHNGTVIGNTGDGEGCDDVFDLYIESVAVPDDAVAIRSFQNCVVFAESGDLVGDYIDPD